MSINKAETEVVGKALRAFAHPTYPICRALPLRLDPMERNAVRGWSSRMSLRSYGLSRGDADHTVSS